MIAPKMLPYLSERETGVCRTILSGNCCVVRDGPGIAYTLNCGSVHCHLSGLSHSLNC